MAENRSFPPQSVLNAFGLQGPCLPISGGQGRSVRVGDAVLKPVEDATEAEFISEVMATLSSSPSLEYRVPIPLLASNSSYVYEGWSADSYCEGDDNPVGRCDELLVASRAFHKAIADIQEPGFLHQRSHPWAIADRVAWEEASIQVVASLVSIYQELISMRRQVSFPSQLVHGDLSGNFLFAEGKPPTIIDFSPFWRCVGYSEAIAIVDGIMDFGQSEELIELGGSGFEWNQLLVRALIFRLVARSELVLSMGEVSEKDVDVFRTALDLVIARVALEA